MTGVLKPCPFCGGEAHRVTIEDDEGFGNAGGSVIECRSCECCTRVFFGECEGLVDAWNRRTITRGDQRRFSEYLASLAATEEAKIDRLREHGDGSMVASAQDLAFGCLVVSAHLAALADGENGE